MSVAAPLQAVPAQPQASFTPAASGVLQRKCACGSSKTPPGSRDSEFPSPALQRKLAIGASNGPLEREADRVADQVLVASPHAKAGGTPTRIQRYTAQPAAETATVPASVDHAIAGSGRPLEPVLRQDMEQRFGHDFSQVRVHSGGVAEQSAQDVNAHAYTVGHNIVFGAGRFAPGTPGGQRLIAHELTHVVHQSGADPIRAGQNDEKRGLSPIHPSPIHPSPIHPKCDECGKKRDLGVQAKLTVNEPGDAYEQEADRVAQAMMGSFSHPAEAQSAPETEPHHPAESELAKGGERLAPDVAEFFETRFGRDFSAVRVHTGETAVSYNNAVNAYAFTYGSHVWLGPGLRPQPSHILAHELAHVVQQTQPPPHVSAARLRPDLSPSPQSVQRYDAYWIPAEFVAKSKTASKRVGTPTHNYVLPKIGAHNHIFTEAPVPNADSKGGRPDFGKTGIADFYDASRTVGLFFLARNRPQELTSNPQLKYDGERYAHQQESAPQAAEPRFGVVRTGSAPTTIRIGDLKPSHGTVEADKGPEQVQDYLKGFHFARDEVNRMNVGTGKEQTDEKWKPLTTGIINLKIPDEFKEETHGSGQKPKDLIQVRNGREVDPPKPEKNKRREFVKGKVYIKESPDKGGIWNYVWEPDADVKAADLPSSVTDMGTDVQSKLITPILSSPVKGAKKAKPARPVSRLTTAPRSIQTQPRGGAAAEVKDPFDKAAFETWQADHRLLTDKKKKLEKTPEFEEAEFKSFAVEDRQAAIKSGFNFPRISKGETAAVKTANKIQFWTGASSAIFGTLRYWFGGAFVKIVNAYHAIRARFQNLLKDKQGEPKKGGLPGTVIRIAFEVIKAAGRFLVERTAQHLIDSLKKGVAQKLKSLIPEDKFEEFEAKVKEVTDLADDLERRAVEAVEALVEKTVGPYVKHIGTITDVADKLSTVSSIVNKVRWGARVIACLSPPGWGCLWILAESVMEKFASWLIDNCWFKKEIAPLVTGIDFIANLPKKMANFIIEGIKGLLPDKLQDVFADIGPEQISTKVPSHEICDKNDYPTNRDRDLVERLALAELRKEIGEEKWVAWIKIGELYGVNRGAFLTEEQVAQLKRELKKADLTALKEAADMYPILAATGTSKDVVNLTTFLEHAQQVKEEMRGGGRQGSGEGEGGAGEISITASEKAVGADYKPTKRKWEVVGGVSRKDYQGNVIKVDVAATINNTAVTLDDVEVRVRGRDAVRNESMLVHLEVTKDQYFDIEKQYGAEAVKKIGFNSFRYKKGTKLQYTLQLKAGKTGK